MSSRSRAMKVPLVAALVATLFAVGGCGAGTSSGTTSNAQLDSTAVLRYVYPNAPGTLDPHIVNTAYANVPLFLIFDRLVHISPAGEAVPGLATSWSFSSDAKVLTFKLRDGVNFQDGTKFDAAAVQANIEHGKNAPGSFVSGELRSVDKVEVVDPLTAAFHLNTPDVALVLKLSDRAGAMMSPKSIEAGDSDVRPVGAGMYELDGKYQTGVKMKVKKFAGYWNPKAQTLAGVEMSFIPDSTAGLNAIKSGSADAGLIRETDIDPAKSAGLNVLEGYDLGFQNIILNPDNVPALKNEKVRLALNLAIDREAIVKGLLFGYGKATNQPFPKGYFAHSDAAQQYKYDPEQAKKLLAEAGYANGFDLTLTNVPGPSGPVNEAVAAQLTKVGVRTKITQVESAALGQQLSVDKSTQAVNVRWTGRPDPSSTIALLYMPGGAQNPSNLASENAVRLYKEQAKETDPKKRAELLGQLSDELVAHPSASQIVLFQSVTAIAASKKVVGLKAWTTGKLEFGGVGMTK